MAKLNKAELRILIHALDKLPVCGTELMKTILLLVCKLQDALVAADIDDEEDDEPEEDNA